jgi:hypothetical protein
MVRTYRALSVGVCLSVFSASTRAFAQGARSLARALRRGRSAKRRRSGIP